MPVTYENIATTTLSSAQSNITFSSIPATYTDLVLVISYFSNENLRAFGARYNGDTGTNYSATFLSGNGSTAGSGRNSNNTYAESFYVSTASSTTPSFVIMNIMNYANTSVNKTCISRGGKADEATNSYVSLWRSTAAINSIELRTFSTGNLSAGTVVTLYGIKAA